MPLEVPLKYNKVTCLCQAGFGIFSSENIQKHLVLIVYILLHAYFPLCFVKEA